MYFGVPSSSSPKRILGAAPSVTQKSIMWPCVCVDVPGLIGIQSLRVLAE